VTRGCSRIARSGCGHADGARTRQGETAIVASAAFSSPAANTVIMRRRTLLSALGSLAGATGLAGCVGRIHAPSPGTTPRPTPATSPETTPTLPREDSGPHPVTPAQSTFEVVDRSCGEGRNEATVTFDGEAVAVDGVLPGRDTCDTAHLTSLGMSDGVLTVVVAVGPAPHTTAVACGQCITDVRYTLRTTIPAGPLEVDVVHRTGGGERTVVRATRA